MYSKPFIIKYKAIMVIIAIEKMRKIDNLIVKKNTGKPAEMAVKRKKTVDKIDTWR